MSQILLLPYGASDDGIFYMDPDECNNLLLETKAVIYDTERQRMKELAAESITCIFNICSNENSLSKSTIESIKIFSQSLKDKNLLEMSKELDRYCDKYSEDVIG